MNNVVKLGIAFAGGLLVGGGVGYLVSLHQMKKQVDEVMKMVDEEFEKMKDQYERRYKQGVYSTPESAVQALRDLPPEQEKKVVEEILNKRLSAFGYVVDNKDADALDEVDYDTSSEDEPKAGNIFDKGVSEDEVGDEIDPNDVASESVDEGSSPSEEEEEEDRFFADRQIDKDLHRPYLITIEEFETENEYDKIELVYFEEDGIVMDEREVVVTDPVAVIGVEFVDNFGNHSDDKDIVYVRNGNYATDYEVHRNKGSYEVQILGILPEKVKTKIPKMKNED